MENNWIKIALRVRETVQLTQLDINKTVEDIIRDICNKHEIQYERGRFALKVQDFCKVVGTEYVTEENKMELRHGRQLKLSKSPEERSRNLIDKLHKSNETESSIKNLKRLAIASKDSVILEEFHRQNILQHLRVYASVRNLSEDEFYIMYKVMGQFLAKGYVNTLCQEEVNQLVDIIICEKKMSRHLLVLVFEILILLRKKGKLFWPMKFLRKLTPYMRLHGEMKLQEKSLQFINQLYLSANDEEEEISILNFMKSSIMITYINKYVIKVRLSDAIKYQLYLYQKIILQKYKKQLDVTDLREEKILENLQYVMSNVGLVNQVRDMRLSKDWTEKQTEKKSHKAQLLLRNLRLSLTPTGKLRTISSYNTPRTEHGSFRKSVSLRENNHENEFLLRKIEQREQFNRSLSIEFVDTDFEDIDFEYVADGEGINKSESEQSRSVILALARDNLYYFILNDYKEFERLLLIHNNQLKSMLKTSIKVSGLLCKIFEIFDNESPFIKRNFVPLCFLYYDYIIERMFCTAMKLYHHNRDEMGITVDNKETIAVIKMVEDQLKIALESEPFEFLELETRLKALTVTEIICWRERMIKDEVNKQLTKQPAFVELRELITPKVIGLIHEKRIRFMESGEHVQQYDHKGQKILGKRWFIHISKIHDTLFIEECTSEHCGGQHKLKETVTISNIREIESGKKSNFHKEVYYNLYNERDIFFRPGLKQQEPEIQFPISIKLHKLVYVDFCAGSELTMDYWVDGLRFLIGEKMNSKQAEEEMDYLMDIELMEHLANLEGIRIPEKPPSVPSLPPHYQFSTD